MDRRTALGGLTSLSLAMFAPWQASAQAGRKLKGYIRTNWSEDPLASGSYSYFAKGSNARDVKALEAPIENRIFFAGEATYPHYNSTVHAAYESGQRVAGFVLDENVKSVAIIGAGMSGLSAAHTLSLADRTVTVFEARDRIGGRVWTRDEMGMPLDCGASWIHGTHKNPLTDLADQLGLTRIETDEDYIIRDGQGGIMADRDAPEWLDDVTEIQHSIAADPNQVNAWAYNWVTDYSGPEVIFPNGYAEVFKALRGDYKVQLSTPVRQIIRQTDSVEIVTGANISASFDAVIVTLPLGVLKHGTVDFIPPLPDRKAQAIQNLGMGTLDKVYLLFEDVFWDEDVTWIATPENGLPKGQFNQWLNLYKYIEQPVIMAFNGGTPALELAKFPDEIIVKRALQTLHMAYPA